MTTSKRTSTVALAALILGTGLLLGYKSAAPAPAIVASIQLETLFSNLDERAEVKAGLDRWQNELNTELERRRDAIKAIEAQRDAAVGEAQKTQLNDQMALAALSLRHWSEIKTRELQTEQALRMEDLYLKIIDEVDRLAALQGYDLVVLNDASRRFDFDAQSRIPAQLQVLQQIASRKILYCGDRVDITDELIDRMNNAFTALQ